MSIDHSRLIIVGSGPAGYTAAIYAARAMMQPTMIAGFEPGGQLMITTDVENFPGFADVIQGPWLMEQMRLQAEHVGTRMISDHIVAADLKQHPFRLIGDSGQIYTCDALIISTGAKARWLGIPSEEKFKGFGVSACATCDGFFYRNKSVVVVGGGNSAVEETLYLANLASHVTLVHRRDSLKAERILQDRLLKHPKISVISNSAIEEICGLEEPLGVTHVKLKNVKTGEISTHETHGVFVAIGHSPASDIFKGQLAMHPSGYIAVEPGTVNTSAAGVYAAGDVADETYRQAVTAAGMGCMAALDAERWLTALDAQKYAAE